MLDATSQPIFVRSCFRKSISECEKIIKFHWKNIIFWLSGYFNMRSLPDAIWVSSWFHFGSKKPSKKHLGGVVGRLGRVLGASWGVLGRLGTSWARLWASWGGSWPVLGWVLARLGRLRAVKGAATYSDPTRRGRGADATRRKSSPSCAPGPTTFKEYQLTKDQSYVF